MSHKTDLSQQKFYESNYNNMSNSKTNQSGNASSLISPKKVQASEKSNQKVNTSQQSFQKQALFSNDKGKKKSNQNDQNPKVIKNSELLNIQVSKRNPKNNMVEQYSSSKVKKTNESYPEVNISFQDSDVADEFEYKFDPNYASPAKSKCMSPRVRMEVQIIDSKDQNMRMYSKTPRLGSDVSTPNFNGSKNSDDDLIHKACKKFAYKKYDSSRRSHQNFMKRMQEDIQKREQREKEFVQVQCKMVQLRSNPVSPSQSPRRPSPRKSPRRVDTSRRDTTPRQYDTSQRSLSPRQPIGDTSYSTQEKQPKRRTLKKSQGIQIYNRLMQYEHQKQKVTKQQVENCYSRLTQDAIKRKQNVLKQQQHQLMLEEEEKRTMYKPKINDYYFEKREGNRSSMKDISTLMSPHSNTSQLESRINVYQRDSHFQVKSMKAQERSTSR